MIASPTLYIPFFYLWFVPYFLGDKLTLLLLTPCLSSLKLYSIFQTTLLLLTPMSVILFLLLQLSGKEVHVEKVLLPLGRVRAECFIVCHGLVEARGDTIPNDIDSLMVTYRGIDIKSINIVQVFLYSTCLFEITNLIKCPVWLAIVAIVFLYRILNLVSSSISVLCSFPPFPCLYFRLQTNACKSLLLIARLRNGKVGIHLKDPCLQIIHGATEFCRWWCFICYHFLIVAVLLLRG